MSTYQDSEQHYFLPDGPTFSRLKETSIKTEGSASPDLPGPLHNFRFQFRSPASSCTQSETSTPNSLYQVGSDSAAFLMPSQPWHSLGAPQHSSLMDETAASPLGIHDKFDLDAVQHTMSFSDEYDDFSEMVEPPGVSPSLAAISGSNSIERAIRRRSSKACDQCRKSKCKCERGSEREPCKNCVMLGTLCTFLGPSRKRGPPKGYIDAIEARLHQTEALLGIMIASDDDRAQSLLGDLARDPLAKEIINRVDNSSYGSKGRNANNNVTVKRPGQAAISSDSERAAIHLKTEPQVPDLQSTHPSNEWQDQVTLMLRGSGSGSRRRDPSQSGEFSQHPLTHSRQSSGSGVTNYNQNTSRLASPRLKMMDTINASQPSPVRRQRRRVSVQSASSSRQKSTSPVPFPGHNHMFAGSSAVTRSLNPSRNGWSVQTVSPVQPPSAESDDHIADAVGQLSLNEDEQVRFHGKASGLHLLGVNDKVNGRNEGGIWRFPKARVWPPLPLDMRTNSTATADEDEFISQLPDPVVQDHLLELYFAYVHPSMPVVHKRGFFANLMAGNRGCDSPDSPASETQSASTSSSCPFNRRRRYVPCLLLFAMFAVAARYSSDGSTPPPADDTIMWAAGDQYLDRAKVILDCSYSSSRPSTCQALLLMGYREIGIGDMTQAWIYIGMAIRMAQDLGMHRRADGWARVGLGGRLFGDWELHERKRIWYACSIMDKYVSSYIGRPLCIFERDFDTPLPNENDPEEFEEWQPHASSAVEDHQWQSPAFPEITPVSGRIISCFNHSATLCNLLGMISQTIYAIHPPSSHQVDLVHMEGLLHKWYISLPEHLRYDPGSMKHPIPQPHVLTLHMQYWCTMLLLHRPFIPLSNTSKSKSQVERPEDKEGRGVADQSYELCAGAANHITSIVSVYLETYRLDQSSVFLCYYIFTASIMHVVSLTKFPTDPQAQMGLKKCMEALSGMRILWPNAGRSLDVLRESTVEVDAPQLVELSNHPERQKRLADYSLYAEDALNRGHLQTEYDVQSSSDYDPAVYGYQDIYSNDVLPMPPGASHVNNAPYITSYERWSPNDLPMMRPFPSPVSTSVLPQIYSTGLVDDRSHSDRGNPVHMAPESPRSGHHASRYPQYWNDLSTFSQLGTAYNIIPEQVALPAHGSSSTTYLPAQYETYNQRPS